MKGIIRISREEERERLKRNDDYLETDFYFKKEDVRSFYLTPDTLIIYLYGQGSWELVRDDRLYDKLVTHFNN